MQSSRLSYLLFKVLQQKASHEDRQELYQLLEAPETQEEAIRLLDQSWEDFEHNNPVFSAYESKQMLEHILNKTKNDPAIPSVKTSFYWFSRIAAMLVLVVSSILIYWYFINKQKVVVPAEIIVVKPIPPADILPGGDKAVLQLGNGSTIALDSIQTGALSSEGTVDINLSEKGLLSYIDKNPGISEWSYNKVIIPRGGQYKLILSDGTKVWLNAASSLRYPSKFTGTDRRVELTGEAYFEVASQLSFAGKKTPFIVQLPDQKNIKRSVEVLGTHFNINAYENELATRTTLIEGKVNIHAGPHQLLLKPGEQARFNSSGKLDKVPGVDLESVLAWKNGVFQFSNADVVEVFRQLERWYDIEIEWKGTIGNQRFEGIVPRSSQLAEVIKILEMSGVRIKQEQKKIIVTGSSS
jgi:ferric-dicitrate binding protein FerR (iron transport regulator)